MDAIDTVSGKLALAQQAQEAGTTIINAMATGNRLDPAVLRVANIYEASVCPLAEADELLPTRNDSNSPEKPAPRRDIPRLDALLPHRCRVILAAEVVRTLLEDPSAC